MRSGREGIRYDLGPLSNYHMAVRTALLCVNTSVFSRGDSDLESTVHSHRSYSWIILPKDGQESGPFDTGCVT